MYHLHLNSVWPVSVVYFQSYSRTYTITQELQRLQKLIQLPSIPEALKEKFSKFDDQLNPTHDQEGKELDSKVNLCKQHYCTLSTFNAYTALAQKVFRLGRRPCSPLSKKYVIENSGILTLQAYEAHRDICKHVFALQAAAKAKKVVDKEKKAREGLRKLEVRRHLHSVLTVQMRLSKTETQQVLSWLGKVACPAKAT